MIKYITYTGIALLDAIAVTFSLTFIEGILGVVVAFIAVIGGLMGLYYMRKQLEILNKKDSIAEMEQKYWHKKLNRNGK